MYAPQLFQGTNADVTVPELDTARDSIRGAIQRSRKTRRYTRLGITTATYWSPAMMLSPIDVPTTASMSVPVDLARWTIGVTRRFRKPAFSTTAAYDRAPR